ncbi:MAG: hypothetical protein WA691_06490 [Thermoplasmata archaeon]
MARWWKPNRILEVGLAVASAGGFAAGGLAGARWGVTAGVEWGFVVAVVGIFWVVAFAYRVWREPSDSGTATLLPGGDLNPLHPREGDRNLIPAPAAQTHKCCWCGFEWREHSPDERPNCHTPTPRWLPEFDPNRTIGFGNDYAIHSFSTLDGRTLIDLRWPDHGAFQANFMVEEFLLRQIREQAQTIGLGLQDLTNERYTVSFNRDSAGAIRIREFRRNPYIQHAHG